MTSSNESSNKQHLQFQLKTKKGINNFYRNVLNQELGEPFRRDAMKKPVEVAGIKKNDMKPQKSLI